MSGWAYLIKGDVVTIQSRNGDYITACEDRKTVALKKELHLQGGSGSGSGSGSNNPHYWTLVDTGLGIQTIYVYHLKSVYGTFLTLDTEEGACKKVCQRSIPVHDNIKRGYRPWVLHSSTCYSNAPRNRFYLQYTHATAVHIDDDGNLVLDTVSEFRRGEVWHLEVVDSEDKAIVQDYKEEQSTQTCIATFQDYKEEQNTQTCIATFQNYKEEQNNQTCVSQLRTVTHHEYSLKSEKNNVVINFYNKMGFNSGPGTAGEGDGDGGGAGPSAVCSTGQNVNGSGTQQTGDVDIRYQVGSYDNLSFEFNLS